MGRTIILVSVNEKLTGVLEIYDPLKTGACDVISILNSLNVKTIMVTSDNQGTARSITIEFENVVAEAKPEQKVKKVKKLQVYVHHTIVKILDLTQFFCNFNPSYNQDQGYVVVMVDVGTTTSPSFIADVGIAIRAGTRIATKVVDVITSNCLEDIITAIDLSNKIS